MGKRRGTRIPKSVVLAFLVTLFDEKSRVEPSSQAVVVLSRGETWKERGGKARRRKKSNARKSSTLREPGNKNCLQKRKKRCTEEKCLNVWGGGRGREENSAAPINYREEGGQKKNFGLVPVCRSKVNRLPRMRGAGHKVEKGGMRFREEAFQKKEKESHTTTITKDIRGNKNEISVEVPKTKKEKESNHDFTPSKAGAPWEKI